MLYVKIFFGYHKIIERWECPKIENLLNQMEDLQSQLETSPVALCNDKMEALLTDSMIQNYVSHAMSLMELKHQMLSRNMDTLWISMVNQLYYAEKQCNNDQNLKSVLQFKPKQ